MSNKINGLWLGDTFNQLSWEDTPQQGSFDNSYGRPNRVSNDLGEFLSSENEESKPFDPKDLDIFLPDRKEDGEDLPEPGKVDEISESVIENLKDLLTDPANQEKVKAALELDQQNNDSSYTETKNVLKEIASDDFIPSMTHDALKILFKSNLGTQVVLKVLGPGFFKAGFKDVRDAVHDIQANTFDPHKGTHVGKLEREASKLFPSRDIRAFMRWAFGMQPKDE